MTTGILWLIDRETLLANIQAAAERYLKRTGKVAELCLLHPSMPIETIPGYAVRHWREVLPGHIVVGREEMPVKESEQS